MKTTFLLLLTLALFACSSEPKTNKLVEKVLENQIVSVSDKSNLLDQTAEDSINNYETYYLVIADTSSSYYELHKKMFDLNAEYKIPIDTLRRYYNKEKKQIVLPDNDDDEMYAGDYFPRRYPSENLSLEYLDFYNRNANQKTIALVSGIYQSEKSADSLLTIIRKTDNKAYKLKSQVYVGCMH